MSDMAVPATTTFVEPRPVGEDFRSRYCSLYGCEPGDFERHLLSRVLFPHVRLLGPLLSLAHATHFQPEQVFARQLARTRSIEQVQADVDFYNHKYVVNSTGRGILNLRISGKKVYRLARELFGDAA